MVTQDLPKLIGFSGDWRDYVEELYKVYERQIVQGKLEFLGLPVKTQYRPPSQGKGFGFWHVISEGQEEAERIPDFRRCERISWIAWVIRNVGIDSRISWWKNKRGSNTHVVLWVEEEDFAVILAERNGYYLLKTAYCTTEHRRESMRRERERYKGL